jgi:predicted DCC family thiol-disulfide oxidoreductase YuxK
MPPTTAPRTIVFYDGQCALCHGFVRFAIRHDQRGHLTFAPIGGETWAARVPPAVAHQHPDSVALLPPGASHPLIRSRAILVALSLLGGRWATIARAARFIPRPVLDTAYRAVASTRRLLFGKPKDACPIVPEAHRDRLLP